LNLSLSDLGLNDCTTSCNASKYDCYDLPGANVTVDGKDYLSIGLLYQPILLSASGPLVDCGLASNICKDAKGAVCLIQHNFKHTYHRFGYQVRSCEDGGGVGAVIYNFEPEIFYTELGSMETSVPFVAISSTDGEHLLHDKIGTLAALNTFDGEEVCFDALGCSKAIPCPSDWFCNFDYDDHGFCEYCSDMEATYGAFDGLPKLGAEQCEAICGAVACITFPNCKFCPSNIQVSSLLSGEERKCEFCPERNGIVDIEYRDREMRMFGPGIDCENVAS